MGKSAGLIVGFGWPLWDSEGLCICVKHAMVSMEGVELGNFVATLAECGPARNASIFRTDESTGHGVIARNCFGEKLSRVEPRSLCYEPMTVGHPQHWREAFKR